MKSIPDNGFSFWIFRMFHDICNLYYSERNYFMSKKESVWKKNYFVDDMDYTFVNVLFGHQNGFTKSKTGATSGTYGYSFDYCISNYSDRVCELEKKSDT